MRSATQDRRGDEKDRDRSWKATLASHHRGLLVATWTATTVLCASLVLTSREVGEESASRLLPVAVLVLATNAALLAHLGPLRGPRLPDSLEVTGRRHLAGRTAVCVVVLFGAGLAGTFVLGLLAAMATVVLVALRREVGRREVGYALVLGVAAGVAGALEEGELTGEQVLSGVLQLPLTVVTLLAGWALARREGWVTAGVGPAAALRDGALPALRLAGLAVVLATPWALSNIVNGPFEDDHVTHWWQALAAAVRPGVAEEAWGRVFVIVLLHAVLRRAARPDTALLAAAVLATLWFAFLHAPAEPVTAVLLALLYGIPITWLFLRRGLEAAIGFHLCSDLVRFGAAFVASQGWWFV